MGRKGKDCYRIRSSQVRRAGATKTWVKQTSVLQNVEGSGGKGEGGGCLEVLQKKKIKFLLALPDISHKRKEEA